MRKLLLFVFLLPALARAQPLTDKFIKGDSTVFKYDRIRAAGCISTIAGFYHRIGWTMATVTTTNDKDTITSFRVPVHVAFYGRVDSIYLKDVQNPYISLHDKGIKFQGGYLAEYTHADYIIVWTRVYISIGNSIKEYAISMEFRYDAEDE